MSDFEDDFGFGGEDEFGEDSFGEEEAVEEIESEAEEAEEEDAEDAEAEEEEEEMDMKKEHHDDHDGHHMKGEGKMMHHDSPFEMMMKVETLMRWSSIDPFMGNLTYLLVAAGVATHAALMAFRYASRSGHYATFLTGTGTNWFEIGDLIQNYANLSLFGIAFVTQLLALFGIATGINAMVWMWGIMLAGGLANGVAGFMKFLAYDNCWDKAASCQSLVKQDMVMATAMDTSVSLALFMQGENWMWGVWEGMTQEEQDTKVEELMMEVEAWEEEMRAEMAAEMGKEGKKMESEDEDEEASADEEEDADAGEDEEASAEEEDADADEDEEASAGEEDTPVDDGEDDGFGDDDGFGGDDDGFGGDDGFGDDFFN